MHKPNATPFAIREMGASDIPSVTALAHRVWHDHYPAIVSVAQIDYMLQKMSSPEAIAKQLADGQRYFLIFEDETLRGYGGLVPRGPDQWYIDKFYVDTQAQGKGLGGALFAHILKALTPRMLTLRVNRKNVKAINFYFKQGFFIEGLDILTLDHGYEMDDFLMRWDG